MRRYPRWPIHLVLLAVSALMLIPFFWVVKTSVSGENIFAYPPSTRFCGLAQICRGSWLPLKLGLSCPLPGAAL